jgi:hypothetical protein
VTSALKMETACFSETLASTNQSTWWFKPKEHQQNLVCKVSPSSPWNNFQKKTKCKSSAFSVCFLTDFRLFNNTFNGSGFINPFSSCVLSRSFSQHLENTYNVLPCFTFIQTNR